MVDGNSVAADFSLLLLLTSLRIIISSSLSPVTNSVAVSGTIVIVDLAAQVADDLEAPSALEADLKLLGTLSAFWEVELLSNDIGNKGLELGVGVDSTTFMGSGMLLAEVMVNFYVGESGVFDSVLLS